jgi:hypothetical protein
VANNAWVKAGGLFFKEIKDLYIINCMLTNNSAYRYKIFDINPQNKRKDDILSFGGGILLEYLN